MKIKLVLLFLLFYGVANSQGKWAPIDAKWHYSRTEGTMPQNEGYVLYESVKDTLIQEKTVRLIHKTYYHANGIDTTILENEYMYEENKKIFYLKNDQFYILYDFNAQAGDKWTIYGEDNIGDFCNYDPVGEVIVDSVKDITINGKELKALYTSPTNSSNWGFNGVIIEQIGCIAHMLPQALDCAIDVPHEIGPLRCYEDSTIGSYKSTYWDKSEYDCETLWNYTSIDDKKNSQIEYFPNPVTEYLNIRLPDAQINKDISFEIWNINGQLIEIEQNSKKLFVGHLSPGVYYALISTPSNIFSFKFLKQ